MSACSDFAEHVWKPGSCKNCFNPLSAHRHRSTGGSLDGGSPAVCLRASSGGDEEPGVTSPSPYSKPTIAVKPTMMASDPSETMTDVNLNIGQENPKKSVERLDLRKIMDLSPLYIHSCTKGLREPGLQSAGTKIDCTNCYTPVLSSPLSPVDKHSSSGSVFVFQEGGRSSCTSKEKANGETFKQLSSSAATRTTKSTYNGGGAVVSRATSKEPRGPSVGIPLSVEVITNGPASAQSHRVNTVNPVALTTEPSSTSPTSSSAALSLDSCGHTPSPSSPSPPSPSEPASTSDSSLSYCSSTDSLPGPERTAGGRVSSEHPQGPLTPTSPQSPPSIPNGQADTEPIYAESTKKKQRARSSVAHWQPRAQLDHQTQQSAPFPRLELSGEGQRATITVVAAHTEENNRTFYLTSPDSAVSTQCHFSPTALKEPGSPTFCWPGPSHSALSPAATESSRAPLLQPKPQSSPPVPPKRNIRSPKLGASSLSPSACSPVPLPELPALSLLSPREGLFKPHTETHGAASERRHKSVHHGPAWNCRIVEEEEEEDSEGRELTNAKQESASPARSSRFTGPVNSAAVRREERDREAQTTPPPLIEPGTAPLPAANNAACQEQTERATAEEEEEARHTGSMLAKASLLTGSSELLTAGKGTVNHEASPPPPPPKKHHRVCGKTSGSNMELERCSQPGSVESLTQSLRGLCSPTLPSASTDSLNGDSGSRGTARAACTSPFARSPLASNPGSPQPFSSFSQPPPLPEKKMVNRTLSAPDSANGKPFVRAYPRLPFSGSESNVCRPAEGGSRSSLPCSPVDPRPMFSSSESLERCHVPVSRPSRSRTLDEPPKGRGRLGVHCRGSVTCSSSPQLSAPFSASEPGSAASMGSCLQLQTLLSNIDSREGVYSKLGGLYAESLRRLALKCEDFFTSSQRNMLRFDESNWSLFKLTCNKPSCSSGDSVYYSAACASDPSNLYAVKICKSPSMEATQGHLYGLSVQQSMRSHFNVQQDCGHFIACVPQSMLPGDEVSSPTTPASSPPHLASDVTPGQQVDQERVVVITREVPQQSAADFARGWEAFHKAQPEVYERRVCFLLLQLCNGLEHLKENGVTHRDLCLENLLLVPHHRRPQPGQAREPLSPRDGGTGSGSGRADSQRHLPRLLISNFSKAKRRSAEDAASASADPRFKRDHARLAPEIVSAAQYRKFDEFQTGILIYELLHQANPFEVSPALKEQDYRCEDLPAIPAVSLYSAGLQRLAQLLLQPDPIKRIHIQEAKRVLQSLLWGPRKDLMEQQWDRQAPGGSRHEGLLNWLDVKRALLMMKFAERSLEPERNAELEDWLCCQYFSSAHPLSLCHTAELLYSLK